MCLEPENLTTCGCGTLVGRARAGFCGAGLGVMVTCTGRKGNPWAEWLAGLAKSCFRDAETWEGGWGEAKGKSKVGAFL